VEQAIKPLTTMLAALSLLAGGLLLAAPVQATASPAQACVSRGEYRRIQTGMPKARVTDLVGSRGERLPRGLARQLRSGGARGAFFHAWNPCRNARRFIAVGYSADHVHRVRSKNNFRDFE
jgi:hypothetical protein